MTSSRSTGSMNSWKRLPEISGRPGEALQHPRPRIQSLSDLIFGLALSIGALNLIASKPPDTPALLGNIATFGFSFLVLIFVWFRYTEIMSVLPVETTRTRALNTVMLFFVAIEPYLFQSDLVRLYSPFESNSSTGCCVCDLRSRYWGDLGDS